MVVASQNSDARLDTVSPLRHRHTQALGTEANVGSILELDAMLDEYYLARGWDKETGLPTADKLRELGLQPGHRLRRSNNVRTEGFCGEDPWCM